MSGAVVLHSTRLLEQRNVGNGCQVCGEFLQRYHELLQRVCRDFIVKVDLPHFKYNFLMGDDPCEFCQKSLYLTLGNFLQSLDIFAQTISFRDWQNRKHMSIIAFDNLSVFL